MERILVLSGKEFTDIVSNRCILAIIIIFIILVICSALSVTDYLNSTGTAAALSVLLTQLSYSLMSYGSILAIMIGFSSMSGEKINKTINTLVSKPIYRDTIINGKLLSSTLFLTGILCLAAAIYTAFFLIFYGNIIGNLLVEYLVRLPIVILIALGDALFYMALSMLLTIIIKKPGVALISAITLFVFLDLILPTVSFVENIYILLQNEYVHTLLLDLSPSTSMTNIANGGLYDSSIGLITVLSTCWPDIARLFVLVIAIMFLSYISFIRSDLT